jgi:membrane-associated phospholipid phosphatase
MLATDLFIPPRDEPKWRVRLARGIWEEAALSATTAVGGVLKDASKRDRPDGSDEMSMPSSHASFAFAAAAATRRNVEESGLGRGAEAAIADAGWALAAATGWARIEGRKHFPSDVLVGAALGNFLSTAIHDAARPGRDERALSLWLDVGGGRTAVAVSWRFGANSVR